jgi:hypothetical protein
MVDSGYPQGILACHTGPADQQILNGVVEHMAHMQHPGNIGRRNDNGIGFPAVGPRFEKASGYPVLIPFIFGLPGIIFGCYFHDSEFMGAIDNGKFPQK